MEQTALRPKPMPGQESGSGGRSGIGRRFGSGRRFGIGRKDGIERKGVGERKGGGGRQSGAGRRSNAEHRPHAARRRGRRLTTLLFGLLFSAVLVLSGVGLGTVGATVIGMSKLADMQKAAQAKGGAEGQAGPGGAGAPGGAVAPGAPGVASQSAVPPPKPPQEESDEAGKGSDKGSGKGGARPALGVEAVDAPGGAGALLVGVHIPGPGHTAGLVRGDVLLALGKTRVGSARALAVAVAAAEPGRNVTLSVRHASGERQSLSVTPGFVT